MSATRLDKGKRGRAMDTITTDAALIMTDTDLFRADIIGTPKARRAETHRLQGMAYVWGRQDAGESTRDSGFSHTFGAAYALADYVTNGYAGNLQGAHHEWHDTGRLVCRIPERRAYVQIAATGPDARVEVRLIPWVDGLGTYWPGIIRKPIDD